MFVVIGIVVACTNKNRFVDEMFSFTTCNDVLQMSVMTKDNPALIAYEDKVCYTYQHQHRDSRLGTPVCLSAASIRCRRH